MTPMSKLGWLMFVWIFTAPAMAQEPVAKVVDLEGDVWITHGGGKPTLATLQYSIFLQDQIETKTTGGVKILFADDTILTVKENSKILITQFLFDPKAKRRRITLEAAFGRLRTIVTQFVGKDQPVEIKTPTAVAGIRGTDLGMMVETKQSTFYCFHCERQEVQTYNREFPSQAVTLASGEAIRILAGRAATSRDITAIPKDILDRIEILFDIQKGASQEAVKQAGEAEVKTSATAPEEKKGEEPTLTEKASQAKEGITSTLENNPQGRDQQTEVIPGGGDEATSGTTVTITLPK